MAEKVAGPVHAAALEAGAEDAPGRRPQALVIAAMTSLTPRRPDRQRAKEPGPKTSASEAPVATPRTSLRPSVLTAYSDYDCDMTIDRPAAISGSGVDPQ